MDRSETEQGPAFIGRPLIPRNLSARCGARIASLKVTRSLTGAQCAARFLLARVPRQSIAGRLRTVNSSRGGLLRVSDPTVIQPDRQASAPLASTGITGLDAILGGGLPSRRLYLLDGSPGTGKTTLALQFLLAGAARGETGLYVTLSESREELSEVATSHGWSLEGIEVFEASRQPPVLPRVVRPRLPLKWVPQQRAA